MTYRSLQRAHYKRQFMKCETCGHERYLTPHKLSAVHVRGLVKCAEARPGQMWGVNRDEMDLERNANGNFAALRWWKLIELVTPGYWRITPLGWDFLAHKAWVPPHVWTLDGELTDPPPGTPEEEKVSIRSVVDEATWQKADYIARRVPVIEPGALVA